MTKNPSFASISSYLSYFNPFLSISSKLSLGSS
eukprot:UN11526